MRFHSGSEAVRADIEAATRAAIHDTQEHLASNRLKR
jgi:hypothetical protein